MGGSALGETTFLEATVLAATFGAALGAATFALLLALLLGADFFFAGRLEPALDLLLALGAAFFLVAMENEDTSQTAFCKKASLRLQGLMRQVNDLSAPLRFQNVRLFALENAKEIMVLDLYPHVRERAFFREQGEVRSAPLNSFQKEQFLSRKTPLLLYLKAHFVGHSLQRLNVSEDSRELLFDFGDRSMKWDLQKSLCILKVEGRKDYQQTLPRWASFEELKQVGESLPSIAVEEKSSKHKKLLQNVEEDLKTAQDWLRQNEKGIRFFLENPALWGEGSSQLPQWTVGFFTKLSDLKGVVFKKEYRKDSLDRMKKLLQRQERKIEKSKERLVKVGEENQKSIAPDSKKILEKFKGKHKKQSPKLGSIQKITNDLEIVVGRKASENDELYRQAQSRDLWFHVRGQKGGHVWLRRGQKGFGAKDEASEEVLKEAALVAVKHSKIRGSWIPVDYTERRYLKKPKGAAEGEVMVLKSKTIFVSFEK